MVEPAIRKFNHTRAIMAVHVCAVWLAHATIASATSKRHPPRQAVATSRKRHVGNCASRQKFQAFARRSAIPGRGSRDKRLTPNHISRVVRSARPACAGRAASCNDLFIAPQHQRRGTGPAWRRAIARAIIGANGPASTRCRGTSIPCTKKRRRFRPAPRFSLA